jgi:hypothetical protein
VASVSETRWAELGRLAGERPERLAHLFGVRRGRCGWPEPRLGSGAVRPRGDELDALVLLHGANLGRAGARP